jgi:glucosamine-6-phosphate deaminase
MDASALSPVEACFVRSSEIQGISARIPYIVVDSFPTLGMLTALRFLEWTSMNPEGVISLPTGKTPEYFISWTEFFLSNWNDPKIRMIREKYGLAIPKRPDLSRLHFVQIDEFYPIAPGQHNSFYYYVNKFYIEKFDLDRSRALLINADEIPLASGMHYSQVFPGNTIDNTLRYRECSTRAEQIQRDSIFMIDDWCTRYEKRIRELGGIGFFLGGIGPDGHIAFNIRGSDHHSTTRLTATNFETQAVAAGDLGGIEISRHRMVITIGLETITYNPDATAIIFAAGESKAGIIKASLESEPTNVYPATVLQKLLGSRFYLTQGAASRLPDSVRRYYEKGSWSQEKTERAVINLCKGIDKYGHHLLREDLQTDPACSRIPDLSLKTVASVEASITRKLLKGVEQELDQTFLHTGPHHDDIMLGLLPHIAHQLRSATNKFHFAILTSGFTAITNSFIREVLEDTLMFLEKGLIQMIHYPDFFIRGYLYKWDKDVYHFLDNVASMDPLEKRRGMAHRVVRAIVQIYGINDPDELSQRILYIISCLRSSYDGEKNPPEIQTLKGMVREFEEELVWAHFGVQVKNIHHLRLGFYTGDIFTEQPDKERDVKPLLDLILGVQPTVISVALDPEGSGPDTHYKVLQTLAEALREWDSMTDLSRLRIWGYRNVWYRFHPAEADVIVPVSLNSLAMTREAFRDCYVSQVRASFPSYEYDGPFSELSQKIWVEQMKEIQLLLGKNFFYENAHPRIRAAHGLIYFREMNLPEFLIQARELKESMERKDEE